MAEAARTVNGEAHDHSQDGHNHSGCGHDHSQCGHDHTHSHDVEKPKHQHHSGMSCPVCGNMGDGVGHDRTMGKLSFALLGGMLTANSYILEWWVPDQTFTAMLSAIAGAFILACPIIFTAIKDLV
ncbi:MAG: hypothetical protein WC071_03380, partial [Victivallaceae bacterium]